MRRLSNKKQRKLTKLLLVLGFVIVIGIFFGFSSIYKSYAIDSNTALYQEIIVKKGDTLWTIAQQFNDNQDIRKLIYEIKKLNKLDQTSIYPGQKLIIPAM